MRTVILWAALALVVAVCLEVGSFAGLWVLERRPLSHASIHAMQRERWEDPIPTSPQSALSDRVWSHEVVHPYVGFVFNPDANAAIGELGFSARIDTIRPDPEAFRVAITGGSFATMVASGTPEIFADVLSGASDVGDRRVEVVDLSLGGFKQPQQLMTLTYFLTLGARFDAVLNLDGFNDVVLHWAENAHDGVAPWFPRNWNMRVEQLPDPVVRYLVGSIAHSRAARKHWARELARPPFGWSMTAALVWRLRDRSLSADIAEAQAVLQQQAPAATGYASTGPRIGVGDEAANRARILEVWRDSSVLMHDLSRARGMVYLHFLQPNQYVPDSKVLHPEELRIAWKPDHLYARRAVEGYPGLREMGRSLGERGVAFHDLTDVYRDVAEPLYSDTCCHVSGEGLRIVAEAMARALRARLERGETR